MAFFKTLFGVRGRPDHNFPEETDDGRIFIQGNTIICRAKNKANDCKVIIDDLQYAYIIVNRERQSFLFLFDHHQNFLPTTFKGFKKVYSKLSDQFGFDDTVFFENLYARAPVRKELWRNYLEQTYEILTDGANEDYAKGFEILSPDRDFISWDTAYDDLQTNANTVFETSPYGQKVLTFTFPVRIGNIVLSKLRTGFPKGRLDVHVLGYYSHCYHISNSGISYQELKAVLQKSFAPEDQWLAFDREDIKSYYVETCGMTLSLTCWYDSDYHFNGGFTLFSVKNKREYSDLLIDREYEERLVVSDYLLLKPVTTSGDYKQNSRVKRRPSILLPDQAEASVIWVDNENGKIGFADAKQCQVFGFEEIESFSIQNTLPARGPGYADLQIRVAGEEKISNFSWRMPRFRAIPGAHCPDDRQDGLHRKAFLRLLRPCPGFLDKVFLALAAFTALRAGANCSPQAKGRTPVPDQNELK